MPNIVKHSYIRARPGALGRARAHVNYIHFRSRPDRVPGKAAFFDAYSDNVSGRTVQATLKEGPETGVLIHKFVLSPGPNEIDTTEYTRKIMDQISHAKGLDLIWFAREHTTTNHTHAHVIILGVDRQGRSVRFDRNDHKLMCGEARIDSSVGGSGSIAASTGIQFPNGRSDRPVSLTT